MNKQLIYIQDLEMTDKLTAYLKANEVGNTVMGMEYKTLKSAILGSLFGTVNFKGDMYLYGMRIIDICDFN